METTTLHHETHERTTYRSPAAQKRAEASGNRRDRGMQAGRDAGQPKDTALLNALTVIAHDLRGPLANLSVLLELIDTYGRMQAYDRMSRSARRAQDLIVTLDTTLQGFLQRTRETGDPLSFRPALVDLADVVRDAVHQNGPLAESRGIALDCARLRPLVVNGDKRLLIEVVDNLVRNAITHGPKEAVVTCAISVQGRHAVIAVRDAGQGLAPDSLKRAFQPFAALSSRFKDRGSSWGFGLWIVRLIVERHGGFIDVVAPGGDAPGTTFEVHLPLDLR